MKGKSPSLIGIAATIVLLFGATQPVTAATNGGTLGVWAEYDGNNPIDDETFYNGTLYDPEEMPLQPFWDPDDVTFPIWLNASNTATGAPLDFIWKIYFSAGILIGGDHSPTSSSPESLSLLGMSPNEYRNNSLTLNIDGPTGDVQIIWELSIWDNGIMQDQACGEWQFTHID